MKLLLLFIIAVLSTESYLAQTKRVRSEKPDTSFCSWIDIESDIFTTSKISGQVTDPANQFIPKARLQLRSQSGLIVKSIKSDKKGNFAFSDVPPGRYSLKTRWSTKATNGFNCKEIQIEVGGSVERPKQIILEVSPVTVLIEH